MIKHIIAFSLIGGFLSSCSGLLNQCPPFGGNMYCVLLTQDSIPIMTSRQDSFTISIPREGYVSYRDSFRMSPYAMSTSWNLQYSPKWVVNDSIYAISFEVPWINDTLYIYQGGKKDTLVFKDYPDCYKGTIVFTYNGQLQTIEDFDNSENFIPLVRNK